MDENILEKVEEKIKEVRTKSLDLSFNEILDMYVNKELKIRPDYQRLFRWDIQRQSQFIESIILEMPLPPIFFVENSDGTYELIDGLQRISTYLKFRGQLQKVDENGNILSECELPTVLSGCDVLEELNGKTFETLSPSIRMKLKRNFIRAEILLNQTDRDLRYHMFKRLNTGGIKLERQEIRNCTVRILGDRFINFIRDLSQNNDYRATISSMSDKDQNSMNAEECILRYFAFKNNMENYNDSDMHKFLDDYLEDVTREILDFNYLNEKNLFENLFHKLNIIFGEELFKNPKINRFNKYSFEAFTLGFLPYLNKLENCNDTLYGSVRKAILDLKNTNEFYDLVSGSFLFKKDKLQQRILMVKNTLKSILER